jgi:hypothetical protein
MFCLESFDIANGPPVAWAHSRFNRPSRPEREWPPRQANETSTICARSAPSRWPMATGFSTASARSHRGGRRRPRHLRPRRNPAVDRACRWRQRVLTLVAFNAAAAGVQICVGGAGSDTSSRTARDRQRIWRPPCPNRRCALNRCKPCLLRPCACAYQPLQRLRVVGG